MPVKNPRFWRVLSAQKATCDVLAGGVVVRPRRRLQHSLVLLGSRNARLRVRRQEVLEGLAGVVVRGRRL